MWVWDFVLRDKQHSYLRFRKMVSRIKVLVAIQCRKSDTNTYVSMKGKINYTDFNSLKTGRLR